MPKLDATDAYYIKLGRGGEWEAEAIGEGFLRFGYHLLCHDLCIAGDWEGVRNAWRQNRSDEGAVTRDIQQAHIFYTAAETTVFVTFCAGRMYWCRPRGEVELLPDRSKRRGTVDGWHGQTVGGEDLFSDRLSGRLLKVQGFRGTICRVETEDYLLRKLGDEVTPEVEAAIQAETQMIAAIVDLMGLLTWKDFELLVDLVFSASGWRRTGSVGGIQKTADIELILPSTQERAFVQVKSKATAGELEDYHQRMAQMDGTDRMFFVWHTGNPEPKLTQGRVTLIGPDKLAPMVLDAGLATWLRRKVS